MPILSPADELIKLRAENEALRNSVTPASVDASQTIAAVRAENAKLATSNADKDAHIATLAGQVADLTAKLATDNQAAIISRQSAEIGTLRSELAQSKIITNQKITAEANRVLASHGHPALNLGVDSSMSEQGGGKGKYGLTGRDRLIAAAKANLNKINE